MIRLFALLLACASAWAADAALTRAAMVPVERQFDERLSRFNPDDPFFLIGTTRAIYLDGYGLVVSAEVNLVSGPGISPFRPEISKEDIARVHKQKLERLPKLRALIRGLLIDSAATVNVPPGERIVVAVTLLNKSWENTAGLPAQIIMQGQRKTLIEAKNNPAVEAAAVQVKEY